MTKKLEVEYACDADGDHMASMAECSESNTRVFKTELEKQNFITECTYVYNLDIAFGNKSNIGDVRHPVLDCLQESYV